MEEKREQCRAQSEGQHRVTAENRECIKITGVDDVESFEEGEIIAYTNMGVLTLRGSDFKISRLDTDSGELVINGELDGMSYSGAAGEKTGFFGRIFK